MATRLLTDDEHDKAEAEEEEDGCKEGDGVLHEKHPTKNSEDPPTRQSRSRKIVGRVIVFHEGCSYSMLNLSKPRIMVEVVQSDRRTRHRMQTKRMELELVSNWV